MWKFEMSWQVFEILFDSFDKVCQHTRYKIKVNLESSLNYQTSSEKEKKYQLWMQDMFWV